MTENSLPEIVSTEENNPSPKLSLEEIAALPGGIFIDNCRGTVAEGKKIKISDELLRVCNIYKIGLDKRLQSRGIVKPPSETDLWPDEYYDIYDVLGYLYTDCDGESQSAFQEAVNNAHQHGNGNNSDLPVSVAGGWNGDRFYFAVRDMGKGIKDSGKSPYHSDMGMTIIRGWRTEDYSEITPTHHTLFLVRDIGLVEDELIQPMVKSLGVHQRVQLKKIRSQIQQGETLPLSKI